jgi:tetratricopeptide (TPR) repeat protein
VDIVEQINLLKAAAGDPALLALTTVDLAYSDLPEPERVALKDALEAASVPHWIDETILGAILGVSAEDSKQMLAHLRALRVLEPFPARGPGAVNVHQASRNVLRERLRAKRRERFVALSAKAREAMRPKSEIAHRIEALYHHFALDQAVAATEWELLEREVAHPLHRGAIAAALDELRREGWLAGAGKAAAILAEGIVKLERGENTQLEESAREAISLAREEDRQVLLGFGHGVLGEALRNKGKYREASEAFRTYLQIFDRASRSDPEWRHEVAVAHSQVASVQEEEGRVDDALQSLDMCLTIIRDLARADPEDWNLQREIATTYGRVGNIRQDQGKLEDALENYRRALGIFDQLIRIDPTDLDWQQGLASSYRNVGTVLKEQGELPEALEAFRKSLELSTKLAVSDVNNVTLQREIASATAWIGATLRAQGKLVDALAAHRENLRMRESLVENDPLSIILQGDLARAQWSVSAIEEELGRDEEAMTGFLRVEAVLDRVVKDSPNAARPQKDLAEIRNWIARRRGTQTH